MIYPDPHRFLGWLIETEEGYSRAGAI